METKWTKWYAMTSHAIAYRSLALLFGTHPFHLNCFFEDFNWVFTQIRCLSRVLDWGTLYNQLHNIPGEFEEFRDKGTLYNQLHKIPGEFEEFRDWGTLYNQLQKYQMSLRNLEIGALYITNCKNTR